MAVVPKASVLSVSETSVVLIATVSKLDKATLAPAPCATQLITPASVADRTYPVTAG